MDAKSMYLQKHHVPELIDSLICRLVEALPTNPRQFLRDELASMADLKFADVDSYPAINTKQAQRCPVLLARVLTREVHTALKGRNTGQGVGIEQCIEDGIEAYRTYIQQQLQQQTKDKESALFNASSTSDVLIEQGPASSSSLASSSTGKSATTVVGFLPGDEESFTVFAELVDLLLCVLLGLTSSTKLPAMKHDVSMTKVTVGFSFNESVVLGASVSLVRNVRPYRLVPSITRAERRDLLRCVSNACKQAFVDHDAFRGSFTELSQSNLAEVLGAVPQRARDLRMTISESKVSAAARREWPDGRGMYLSSDHVFAVSVGSEEEHLTISSLALNSHNIREAFERTNDAVARLQDAFAKQGKELMHSDKYGYLTANLKLLHTGLTFNFALHLPNLAKHPALHAVLAKFRLSFVSHVDTNVIVVCNPHEGGNGAGPLSSSEAEMLQATSNSVNKVIEFEVLLATGGSIDGKV